MAENVELRRRYRRLMWAFPGWYRRYRGEEMLTTLLDNARPGQRRPTVGEALDIVAGAVRCRLRPPHPGYLLILIPVSVFAAMLGSVLAIGTTFAVLAPIPTEDEGARVAQLATGIRPHNDPAEARRARLNVPAGAKNCDETGCVEFWDPAGDQVVMEDRPMYRGDGMDAVVVGYWTPDYEMPTWIRDVRTRLTAAGWTVNAIDARDPAWIQFTADKGDWQVIAVVHPGQFAAPAPGEPLPNYTPTSLTLKRHQPSVTPVSSTVGFLLGLLIGWLTVGWVIRRGRELPDRRRTPLLLWGTAASLLVVLVDSETAAASINFLGPSQHPLTMVPTQFTSVLAIFVVPALFAVLATIWAAARPSGERARRGQPRPAA